MAVVLKLCWLVTKIFNHFIPFLLPPVSLSIIVLILIPLLMNGISMVMNFMRKCSKKNWN
ncbi:hypothetical protein X975_03316, partial [Stegodyphus mimosarum]